MSTNGLDFAAADVWYRHTAFPSGEGRPNNPTVSASENGGRGISRVSLLMPVTCAGAFRAGPTTEDYRERRQTLTLPPNRRIIAERLQIETLSTLELAAMAAQRLMTRIVVRIDPKKGERGAI